MGAKRHSIRNFRFQVCRFAANTRFARLAALGSALIPLAMLLCNIANAGPMFYDPETWSGSDLAGWTNAIPEGTQLAELSNEGGYLQMRFQNQAGFADPEDDLMYTKSAGEIGNFQIEGMKVQFLFQAQDVLPLHSILYLHELGAPATSIWEYAFNNTVAGEWQAHMIFFSYGAGWIGPGGSGAFWTALANIDYIGISIARKLDTMVQDYWLADWVYSIPEPTVASVLGTVLISLAYTFRKRSRKESPG